MSDLTATRNPLARPGSFKRAWWHYLSSSASTWLLWALAGLADALLWDHSNDEYWGLAVYVAFVVGTVLMFALNAVVWFTLGWLIDAKASPTWPWYLGIGVVLGVWVTVPLWNAPVYAFTAGFVVAIGGYVLGPLVAQAAFRSRGWRIAVTAIIVAALASVLVVLL